MSRILTRGAILGWALSWLHIRAMRFRVGDEGFRLWEAVRMRVGADVVLTFCNGQAERLGRWSGATGLVERCVRAPSVGPDITDTTDTPIAQTL